MFSVEIIHMFMFHFYIRYSNYLLFYLIETILRARFRIIYINCTINTYELMNSGYCYKLMRKTSPRYNIYPGIMILRYKNILAYEINITTRRIQLLQFERVRIHNAVNHLISSVSDYIMISNYIRISQCFILTNES